MERKTKNEVENVMASDMNNVAVYEEDARNRVKWKCKDKDGQP